MICIVFFFCLIVFDCNFVLGWKRFLWLECEGFQGSFLVLVLVLLIILVILILILILIGGFLIIGEILFGILVVLGLLLFDYCKFAYGIRIIRRIYN